MKKIIKFTLILGIILLVLEFSVNLFKNKHKIDYSLSIDNKTINIHEEYSKEKDSEYYYFKVNIDGREFVFDNDNDFNKQKKVINDIKIYEKDDLMCISPVYIKLNKEPLITCNLDNKQYSYNSIKDQYDLSEFVSTIDNFNKDKYISSQKITTVNGNNVYSDNFKDNEIILLYEYNHLVKLTNKSNSTIKFAQYDIYNNELGILVDKYYVLPKYENLPEYKGLMVIDIIKEKTKEISIPSKLSTNIYINGIVDNKLYFFDKSNLIQYQIDPKKAKYEVVSDKKNNAKYYDGKWTNKNIYEFFNNNIKFTVQYPIADNYKEAFESSRYYYYYNSDNEFYKVYKKDLSKKVYLFKFDDIKEVRVINDNIYFIHNDLLYRYDLYGLKELVSNNEFNYNYQNIYSAYID